MSSPYLNHATLNTGHVCKSFRSEIASGTVDILRPWITGLINHNGTKMAFPIAELKHFSALALTESGLVMTVYGPASPHIKGAAATGELPLITFGVAQVGDNAQYIWDSLSKIVRPNFTMPSTPWCGVILHPSLLLYQQDISWLADFERCVAWTWISGNASLKAV